MRKIENKTNNTQKVGLIIIGDELLNASRQDKHLQTVIEMLSKRGMKLNWMHLLGDNEDELVALFKSTMATNDLVFSCGGIGATPDDLTRQCAAIASNQKLVRHPEAQALLEKKYGEKAYPHRILMSELPEKADIIPNPVNQVPGFSINHHYFVPGFPSMATPMIEWVLDTKYTHLFSNHPDIDVRWNLHQVGESELMMTMRNLLDSFPDVALSSLPRSKNKGWMIDFGLKGQPKEVEKAGEWFETQLQTMQISFDYRGEI